jgi:pantetheine-phosphate adenylyltransferase
LTVALYPGSFDPVTNGHVDIASRASVVFGKLLVGIYDRPAKSLLFTAEERLDMAREALAYLPNVQVETYSCLTVDFARQVGARCIVRGLRMSSDFEREFEMTLMNRLLAPDLETVCLMTSIEYQFLSSTLLKEVAELDGDIEVLVPKHVIEALKRRFSR